MKTKGISAYVRVDFEAVLFNLWPLVSTSCSRVKIKMYDVEMKTKGISAYNNNITCIFVVHSFANAIYVRKPYCSWSHEATHA